LPIAPGTWGTLAAAPLVYGLSLLPEGLQVVAGGLFVLASVPIAGRGAAILARKDPGPVVIDEAAGFLVTMFAVSGAGFAAGPWQVAAGFFLFRVMDVLKPPPARGLERLPGGLGVVADDLMAGVYANIALRLVLWVFSGTV
jgi:phosphatidylglycerophosphatase A